ncbi:unnamed protein product, partial [Ceratitis capitata]
VVGAWRHNVSIARFGNTTPILHYDGRENASIAAFNTNHQSTRDKFDAITDSKRIGPTMDYCALCNLTHFIPMVKRFFLFSLLLL